MIRSTLIKCFIEDFVNTQTSSTSCYKLINIIKNETPLPDVMFFNGEQKVNDLEKATAFNKYFSFCSDFPDILTDFSDGIHNSLDCSLSDCEKALRLSKQGCGPNGIPGTVYANTAIPLSVHFLQLAKCATEHGIYPSDWKHSYVKPLFKTGKRSSLKATGQFLLLTNYQCVLKDFFSPNCMIS